MKESLRWRAKKILPKKITDLLRKALPESIYYPDYGQTTLSDVKFRNMMNILKENLLRNPDGDLIECGVYRGGSLIHIATKMKELKSSKKLYGIDTFEGHPYDCNEDIPKDGNTIHKKGLFSGSSYEKLSLLIKKKNLDNVILYKGLVEDVLPKLSDKKFCFAHLDLDLYLSTKEALYFLKPRMVKNGIIVFDDYGGFESPGIKKAAEEVLDLKNITQVDIPPNEGNQEFWIKR